MQREDQEERMDVLEVNLRGINQQKLNKLLREKKEVQDALLA